MEDRNQRQAPRTPVTLKIKFKSETLDQFIERYSVDISSGGIFIRTKEPLAVGTTLHFEFQLKDASPLIRGEGTVVWTREPSGSSPGAAPGMGVRFDQLPGESRDILGRILSDRSAQPQHATPEPGPAPGPAGKGDAAEEFVESPTRVAPSKVLSELADEPADDFASDEASSTRVAPEQVRTALSSEASGARARPARGAADRTAEGAGGKVAPRSPAREKSPLPQPLPFDGDANEFDEGALQETTKVANYDSLGLGAKSPPGAQGADGPSSSAGGATGEDDLEEAEGDAIAAGAEALGPAPREAETDAGVDPGGGEEKFGPERGEDAPAQRAPAVEDDHPDEGGDGEASEDRGDEEDDEHIREVREALARKRTSEEAGEDGGASADAPPADEGGAIDGDQPELAPDPAARATEEPAAGGAGEDRAGGDRVTSASPQPAARATEEPAAGGGGKKIVIAAAIVAAAGGATALAVGVGAGSDDRAGAEGEEEATAAADVPREESDPEGGPAERPGAESDEEGKQDPADEPTAEAEPAMTSSLVVETEPAGARVEIEEADRSAESPATFEDLDAERAYRVRVSAPGHREEVVEAAPGGEPTRVELEPLPRVLAIDSRPPGALVEIDGERTGERTPAEIALGRDPAGGDRYEIILRRTAFHPAGETLDVDDGDFEEVDGEKLLAELNLRLQRRRAEVADETAEPDDGEEDGEGEADADDPAAGEGDPAEPSTGDDGDDDPDDDGGWDGFGSD